LIFPHYQNLPTSAKALKPIELARSLMKGTDTKAFDTRLEMAVGQALRARQRLLYGVVEDHIGYYSPLVREKLLDLAIVKEDLIIVPGRQDRRLSGMPAYIGGNPPSPYQWAPVIRRHTNRGDDIWEFGAGVIASAMYAAKALRRRSALVGLPLPGSRTWLRFSVPDPSAQGPKRKSLQPALAIVPLPLPCDDWSLFQHRRFKRDEPSPTWQVPSDDTPLGDVHPEFSETYEQYLLAIRSRLSAVAAHMSTGSHLCVSAPMVRGVPVIVERLCKSSGWPLKDRITVLTQGGATHRGDGSPLIGEILTVWEIQR